MIGIHPLLLLLVFFISAVVSASHLHGDENDANFDIAYTHGGAYRDVVFAVVCVVCGCTAIRFCISFIKVSEAKRKVDDCLSLGAPPHHLRALPRPVPHCTPVGSSGHPIPIIVPKKFACKMRRCLSTGVRDHTA